jgi:hypothetical protein
VAAHVAAEAVGSEPASKFTEDYEAMHVAHGPFALAPSLGVMSEAITDLRARVEERETN